MFFALSCNISVKKYTNIQGMRNRLIYALMQGKKKEKGPMWPMRLLECEPSIVLKSCIRSFVSNQMLHVALHMVLSYN